jgi:hypothetical protein
MAWYPGAKKREIRKHRTRIQGPRRVINHVAVSNGKSLYGYFSLPSTNVCSHFYVAKDGTVEQYVSTAYRAPANYQANDDSISIETAGGVTDANSEPWTPQQVVALIKLHRWIHDAHDIPMVMLPDSKSGRRGVGYHRQGIDPWRVSGGEYWSTARGKICPGSKKISQLPGIVRLAKEDDEDMPTAREVADELASNNKYLEAIGATTHHNVWLRPNEAVGDQSYRTTLTQTRQHALEATAQLAALTTAVNALAAKSGASPEELAAIQAAADAGATAALQRIIEDARVEVVVQSPEE